QRKRAEATSCAGEKIAPARDRFAVRPCCVGRTERMDHFVKLSMSRRLGQLHFNLSRSVYVNELVGIEQSVAQVGQGRALERIESFGHGYRQCELVRFGGSLAGQFGLAAQEIAGECDFVARRVASEG